MRVPAFALAAAAAVVLAGCTSDDAPEPLEERSVAVYLVREGKVAPVRRTVTAPSEGSPIAETLGALIEGPSAEERSEGYRTDVTLEGPATTIDDGVVTLEPQLDGSLSELGMAQIVHTLSQFPDVRQVRVGNGEARTTRSFEEQTPQVLLESPLPGDSVTSPIRLRGTANVFEATVSLEVRDSAEKVLLESFTTATSGNGTRGTFATELELPDAEGPVTIVVFESSAEDGRPLHVFRVPVTLDR